MDVHLSIETAAWRVLHPSMAIYVFRRNLEENELFDLSIFIERLFHYFRFAKSLSSFYKEVAGPVEHTQLSPSCSPMRVQSSL